MLSHICVRRGLLRSGRTLILLYLLSSKVKSIINWKPTGLHFEISASSGLSDPRKTSLESSFLKNHFKDKRGNSKITGKLLVKELFLKETILKQYLLETL